MAFNRKSVVFRRGAAVVVVVSAVLLVCAVYFLFDPARLSFFPRCPFHVLTGWKCPGCGSQRALHQLVHLHFAEAFRYNALLVLSIPLLLFLFAAELLKGKCPRLYAASHSTWLSWTILTIILLWWVGRNVLPLGI